LHSWTADLLPPLLFRGKANSWSLLFAFAPSVAIRTEGFEAVAVCSLCVSVCGKLGGLMMERGLTGGQREQLFIVGWKRRPQRVRVNKRGQNAKSRIPNSKACRLAARESKAAYVSEFQIQIPLLRPTQTPSKTPNSKFHFAPKLTFASLFSRRFYKLQDD